MEAELKKKSAQSEKKELNTMEVLEDFVPTLLKKRLTPAEVQEITDKTELSGALIADPNSPSTKRPLVRKDWKLKMSKDFD